MNRFARGSSKYSYYNYLNLYTPEQLRKYQTGRYYYLGRRGAFDNLVYKAAGNSIGYEEDMNLTYKTPIVLANFMMRVTMYWAVIPAILISFYLGDMGRIFTPIENYSAKRPSSKGEVAVRYESMYISNRPVRY